MSANEATGGDVAPHAGGASLRPMRGAELVPDAPADAAGILGRLLLVAVGIALVYGLLELCLGASAREGAAGTFQVLRLAVFGLALCAAAALQGAQLSSRALALLALSFGLAGALGHYALQSAPPSLFGEVPAARHVALDWLRLETTLLGSVCLGLWCARGLHGPGPLLTAVLCLTAGDAWLSARQVPASLSEGHPLHLLRLPWPAAGVPYLAAPSVVELTFAALGLEASRRLGYPVWRVGCAMLTAYALDAAGLLTALRWAPGQEPLAHLMTLPLVSLGLLLGAWPHFRCPPGEVFRALLCALVLFGLLHCLGLLRARLYPRPDIRPPQLRYPRNLAQGRWRGRQATEPGVRRGATVSAPSSRPAGGSGRGSG